LRKNAAAFVHRFIFTTNEDGSVKNTYSWGNKKNDQGWNKDQPEDLKAARDGLKRTGKKGRRFQAGSVRRQSV
jgi:hypothetical protein